MIPDEGFGPAGERSLTIEECVIKIKKSKTHDPSIAGPTHDLLRSPDHVWPFPADEATFLRSHGDENSVLH